MLTKCLMLTCYCPQHVNITRGKVGLDASGVFMLSGARVVRDSLVYDTRPNVAKLRFFLQQCAVVQFMCQCALNLQ